MKHYVIAALADATLSVTSYKSAPQATAAAATMEGAVTATDKDLTALTMQHMVDLYNTIRPEKPIKKFADRPTALKRMEGVLEALAKPGAVVGNIAPAAAGEGGAAAEPTEKGVKAGKLKGMAIRFLVAANPRKPGTSGHRSRELAKDGMTVEEFLQLGGVRRDLEWDIAHKWTAVEPTDGSAPLAPVVEEAPAVAAEAPATAAEA